MRWTGRSPAAPASARAPFRGARVAPRDPASAGRAADRAGAPPVFPEGGRPAEERRTGGLRAIFLGGGMGRPLWPTAPGSRHFRWRCRHAGGLLRLPTHRPSAAPGGVPRAGRCDAGRAATLVRTGTYGGSGVAARQASHPGSRRRIRFRGRLDRVEWPFVVERAAGPRRSSVFASREPILLPDDIRSSRRPPPAGGGRSRRRRPMGEPIRPTNKTDLSTCLPFERPVFELERKLDELMALSDATEMHLNGELKPLLEKRDRMLVDSVAKLGPWERVQIARHPRRPQFRDYATGDGGRPGTPRRVDRVEGRPPLRRRQGDLDRLRPARALSLPPDRAPQGARDEGEARLQLRLRASRGVPQGASEDEARREVRAADRDLHQHAGRLSGHRCRGARAGLGDRREHPRDERAARADAVHRDRRGRQRRGARHRRGRPRADARARLLLGDLARGVRRDPVEERREGAPRPPGRFG